MRLRGEFGRQNVRWVVVNGLGEGRVFRSVAPREEDHEDGDARQLLSFQEWGQGEWLTGRATPVYKPF